MIISDVTTSRLPVKALPLLYLGSAHTSLALALLLAGCWPQAVAGFFYHAWLIGLVHLVTLGWLSFSILGAFYIVGPLALRMEMPARRLDYAAYAFALIGLLGMLGHFWIQEYGGMAWSAGTIACGLLYMSARIAVKVIRAKVHGAVKLHVVLACVNLWMAASMGLLLAIDKVVHFLPGFVLANVFAHAHLAALGWVTMMIVGVGYRMLPMLFPSKMPSGWSLYASAALLEIGVIGLFHSLLMMRSRLAAAFGVTIVLALAVFAGHVLWMRRHLVSKPAGAPRIDFGLLHAAGAGASLAASIALGLLLLVRPASEGMLRAAAAYGVLGLLGFMSQMVVAMESRLLPMAAWLWAYAASGYRVTPTSPHAMRDPSLQAIALAGWSAGVPALAAGMFRASAPLVAVGAWTLFVGVAVAALDSTFVLLHGLRGSGTPP